MAAYTIDGIQHPSVTTVLGIKDKSSALMPWVAKMMALYIMQNARSEGDDWVVTPEILANAKKNYRKASSEAMDIGSEVHKILEEYIKNGKDAIGKLRPEVENAVIAFFEWETKKVAEWLESEQTVWHSKECFAGTLDAIARMKDGKVYLIDFKSSTGFWDGYGEQLALYKLAREEDKPGEHKFLFNRDGEKREWSAEWKPCPKIDGIGVLRLDKKDGKPYWKDYSEKVERYTESGTTLLTHYYAEKKRQLKNNPRVH